MEYDSDQTGDVRLGANIRKFREQAKLSQEELAAKVGVTKAAVSSWENARNGVRRNVLPKLASALGITSTQLMPSLAEPHQSQVDVAALARVLETIEAAAQSRFLALRPEQKAKLIVHLYGASKEPAVQEIHSLLLLLE